MMIELKYSAREVCVILAAHAERSLTGYKMVGDAETTIEAFVDGNMRDAEIAGARVTMRVEPK